MALFRRRYTLTNLSGHPDKSVECEKVQVEDAEVLYEDVEGVFAEVRLVVLDENLREERYVLYCDMTARNYRVEDYVKYDAGDGDG